MNSVDTEEASSIEVSEAAAPGVGTAPKDEAYVLPAPSKSRNAAFTVLLAITCLVNLAAALAAYSIFSGGNILPDLYGELSDADLATYIWITAGVAGVAIVLTMISYLLSLDYRRAKRPAVRLHVLFATFFLFAAGAALGAMDVAADNVLAIIPACLVAMALPVLILLLEKAIGKGFFKSARGLLRRKSYGGARTAARSAMRFNPAIRESHQIYGLALAHSARSREALPYLITHSSDITSQPAEVAAALSNIYEATGDHSRAVLALETLHRHQPEKATFERLIHHWLTTGRKHDVLRELQALPPAERTPWMDTLRDLVFEIGDMESQRAFCREVELSEGPPYQKTHACYSRMLERHPDDTETYRALIQIARRRGDAEHAAQLLEHLLAHDPHGGLEDRRNLVSFYWTKGDRQSTLRHLNRIYLSGQANLDEKVRLLEENFAEGDYARVEEMVAHDEDLRSNARALSNLAFSLWEAGRLEESREYVKKARELEPDAALQTNLDALEGNIKARQLANSLEELRERVRENPEDLDLRFEYYDKLVPSGKADRVVIELEQLLDRHPEHRARVEREIRWLLTRHGRNFRLLDYLGDLYMRDGDFDRAFELYEERVQGEIQSDTLLHESAQKVLARAPEHKPALLSEVRFHQKQNDYSTALGYLERYYASGGEANVGLRELEFEAAIAGGNRERAEEVGKLLLDERPEDAGLLTRMSEIATELQHFDDAAAYLDAAQKIDPENHLYRRMLKQSEEKRKLARMEEIAQLIKDGQATDDLHEELGDLHHDFGHLNEAMAEYQRASHGAADRRRARAKLAYVLARKGMHEEADETLHETELRPDLPAEELNALKALFYTCAELMEEDGDDERALNSFRRVFRVDASYRDVVTHVERLQRSEQQKKKKREQK